MVRLHAEISRENQTDTQTHRQTDTQIDRHTRRQTDIHGYGGIADSLIV